LCCSPINEERSWIAWPNVTQRRMRSHDPFVYPFSSFELRELQVRLGSEVDCVCYSHLTFWRLRFSHHECKVSQMWKDRVFCRARRGWWVHRRANLTVHNTDGKDWHQLCLIAHQKEKGGIHNKGCGERN
jgi:hypothetical protein